ncbi:MAG: hypothetical protein OHK0056_33290 [Bacteriovoracaceae bacterium]
MKHLVLFALVLIFAFAAKATEVFPRYFIISEEKFCMVLDEKGDIVTCNLDQNCQEYPQCLEHLPKSF